MDKIVIMDLEVPTRIGVTAEERRHPQRLQIAVELEGDFHRAAASDSLDHTINYFDVCEKIKAHCGASEYRLIEKLAGELAGLILREFGPASVAVEVKKFIIPEARYVSFTLRRTATDPKSGGGLQ